MNKIVQLKIQGTTLSTVMVHESYKTFNRFILGRITIRNNTTLMTMFQFDGVDLGMDKNYDRFTLKSKLERLMAIST